MIPASLLVAALLVLGLWPRSISERVDPEIIDRYSTFDAWKSGEGGVLPCCAHGTAEEANATSQKHEEGQHE